MTGDSRPDLEPTPLPEPRKRGVVPVRYRDLTVESVPPPEPGRREATERMDAARKQRAEAELEEARRASQASLDRETADRRAARERRIAPPPPAEPLPDIDGITVQDGWFPE